ncbi:hypothetical protein SBF1_2620003 [Candidatus Desulfosporosinus infrequens]|uniref:Uncharacterized protein n=1 Tax=Candidatus Desulfosporosinus infrequens TaxID=2043169 RepID=A0A2U3KRT0_9FIRM|nr:hypothetical protein SBF1_2620003 [Candidatus Desulfosporosinus infrequens]
MGVLVNVLVIIFEGNLYTAMVDEGRYTACPSIVGFMLYGFNYGGNKNGQN